MPFWLETVILLGVGFISGFVNILAGGGSLLTLPVLIFLGLPGAVANGTNRIAILIQNFVAIAEFRRYKILPLRVSLIASLPAAVGAVIGANIAVTIPDRLFKPILAVIMISVMVTILIDPARRIRPAEGPPTPLRLALFAIGFFFVGLYGGFIQAGIGFFIITLMLAAGFDLVRTNAVKILIVTFFTLLALAIFIANDQVDYFMGTVMGVGSAAGAWLATHVAVRKGHAWIRIFVLITVLLFSAQLLIDTFMD